VGDDFHYHSPGGAGLRGIDPRVSAGAAIGLNLELEHTLLRRPTGRLFNRVGLAAFIDMANVWDGTDALLTRGLLHDAGIGLRADHRIGDTRFTTRFDLPLIVTQPDVAQGRKPGDENVEFRWTFSFEPAF
jgi:hemolysin activation/secretion protein